MKRWLSLIPDIIFPCFCVSCGKPVLSGDNYLCGACRDTLKTAEQGCMVCSHRLADDRCHFCSTRRFYPARHISLFEYEGAAKAVVHALKFGGIKNVYRVLTPYLAGSLESFGSGIDLVTYVPMNSRKFAERGFNQSELLARALSEASGIPVISLLKERGNSTPQREFSFSARYINVIDRYETVNNNKLTDRTILLIDDVFTTGATINECARQLLTSGARKVFSLTAARSDLKKLENF